jgi:hypothetical protein
LIYQPSDKGFPAVVDLILQLLFAEKFSDLGENKKNGLQNLFLSF